MPKSPLVVPSLTLDEAEVQFPGPSEFVHLHNHTLFSLLDGVATPDEYFRGCVDRDWPAFAITEHGVLNSIPDAYLAAKEHKKKFIVGCEIYYNDYELIRQKELETRKIADIRADNEDFAMRMTRNRHLTVLCRNMVGYENLLKINKYAYEHGFYYRPRVWLDQLAKYREGLVILSGCLNGPVCHELRAGNLRSRDYIIGAIDYVNKFRDIFGENYYLELQMPGIENDVKVFRQLVAIADSLNIKLVLTNDTHYMNRRDWELQKLMMAISQNTTVDDPNLFHVNSDEQYFKTRAELRATFARRGYEEHVVRSVFEQACDNTLEIADRCESFCPNMEPKLPKLRDDNQTLTQLANAALRARGLDKDTTKYMMDGAEVTYEEQMNIELERFIEKGFASYFLITQDLVKESYRHHWPLGPARGCVTSDSKIRTVSGYKPIIDISIGDEILDGFNDVQVVENKLIYDVNEELYVIILEDGRCLNMTSDHKLFVIRDGTIICEKASGLKNTDEIIDILEEDQNAEVVV